MAHAGTHVPSVSQPAVFQARTLFIGLGLMALLALGACSRSRGAGAGACCPPEPVCCSDTPPPPPSDRPPNAKDGEAWCQVWIPPVKKTVVETYCICPQRSEKVRVPAEYACRPKLVCVSSPKVREVVQPGVWSAEKRDVLVCDERETWRKVCCEENSNLAPCEVQRDCYVKTVCPPVWREECRSVCVAEPKKCVKFTPAQHKLVTERYLIRPTRCETRVIPAKYGSREREICVTPGKWVWRRNLDCEVPEELLAALEVEMIDSSEGGEKEGVFAVGSTVRYDLIVRSDEGGEAFPMLKAVFEFPPQLEFVSGEGAGIEVTGDGQGAQTTTFQLPEQGEVKVFILARVLSAPATAFVQTRVSIQTEAGEALTFETESTTLATPGEK